MAEQRLTGLPAAPGTAAGSARVLTPVRTAAAGTVPAAGRADELERARAALATAAAELDALAARLRAGGRPDEADIVATGALMAARPGARCAPSSATRGLGFAATAAVLEACGEHADAIAALGDEHLAARAEDVRSLGRRAARLAQDPDAGDESASREPVVLLADDLGPADVAELDAAVVAVALAAGTPTGHAAVVARGARDPAGRRARAGTARRARR